MSAGVRVRPERDGEAATVAALVAAAFGREAEALLVDWLRAAGVLAVSLVAEDYDGLLVGHVALSPVTVDGMDGGGRWFGLAPLAVRPDRQRRGIGATLARAALAWAEAEGAEVVVVLGEPAYYGRLGFAPASRHGLAAQWPVPDEAFMARVGDGAWVPAGVVRYHPAFDGLV